VTAALAPPPSPDRRTLTAWRVGVAAVAALGLLHLAWGPALTPAPAGLLGALSAWDLAAVAAALAGLARFASGPGRWLAGLIALAALGSFIESHAPAFRAATLYASMTLAGWLLGLAFARALGLRPRPDHDRDAESLAASGALAALAATQVASAITKVVRPDAAWFDGWPLRLSILMDHPIDDVGPLSAIWRPVVDSLPLALATSWWIFLAELAALALPFVGPRLRAAIALHLAFVHLSFGVFFQMVLFQAPLLLVLLGVHWRRRRSRPTTDPKPPDVDTAFATPLALAVMVAAALLFTIPEQSGLRVPEARLDTTVDLAQPPAPEEPEASPGTATPALGPLRVGQDLISGWRITSLRIGPAGAEITVGDPGGRAILFTLCPPDAGCPAGLYAVADGRLTYAVTAVPDGEVLAPARALADALAAEAASGVADLIRRWSSAASPAP
jgi:hypothetical protein